MSLLLKYSCSRVKRVAPQLARAILELSIMGFLQNCSKCRVTRVFSRLINGAAVYVEG